MDSDQLRIVLLILGVLLVVGIYAWDRIKKRRARPSHGRVAVQRQRAAQQREPTLDGGFEADAGRPFDDLPVASEHNEPLLADLDVALDPDSVPSFSAGRDDDSAVPTADMPQKIIMISIIAKHGEFSGEAIVRAAKEVELKAGDMNIFHRHDAEHANRVLFSMASMVEPGSFPFHDMTEFSSPGLTLFAQLPGPRDGLVVYSDMLFTGERLAVMLGGELHDEKRNLLTKQWIEHTRAGILEHRRQLHLARGRA